jgi:hypothetical protein
MRTKFWWNSPHHMPVWSGLASTTRKKAPEPSSVQDWNPGPPDHEAHLLTTHQQYFDKFLSLFRSNQRRSWGFLTSRIQCRVTWQSDRTVTRQHNVLNLLSNKHRRIPEEANLQVFLTLWSLILRVSISYSLLLLWFVYLQQCKLFELGSPLTSPCPCVKIINSRYCYGLCQYLILTKLVTYYWLHRRNVDDSQLTRVYETKTV